MNISLQVFQTREVSEPNYSAPTLDVLDDSGNRDITPPEQPTLSWVFENMAQWISVETATSYRFQKKVAGGVWTDLVTVDAVEGDFQNLTDAGIVPLAFYRVIAVNAAGNSTPSHPMFVPEPPIGDFVPEPPTIVPDSEVSWEITADGFIARWVPQPGVVEYFIDVAPDNDANYAEFNDFNIGLVHEFAVTALTAPAAFWTFRVRAGSGFGISDSSTVLVTPAA